MPGALQFRHQAIDPDPPGAHHDITLVADLNHDGRPDIIIGGKSGDVNLFWYENPSWRRHDIASAPDLEAGGVLLDINGDGRLDIVAGQQWNGRELYWFECPPDPTQPWPRQYATISAYRWARLKYSSSAMRTSSSAFWRTSARGMSSSYSHCPLR